MTEFSDLLGETLIQIDGQVGDDEMIFRCASGRVFRMFHYQNCCESVSVEDICGDMNSLLGFPILEAEEVISGENPPDVDMSHRYQDSFTWTFYKLRTMNGGVTIRWYGASNGYYSERVSFKEVTNG